MKSNGIELLNPLILALDLDDAEAALALVEKLQGTLGAVKIGPRLALRYGADIVAKLAKVAPVFVDNKYLDIPSTMEAAVRATFAAGATFTTVHAWAGAEALKRLAEVEAELKRERPFQILTVTILTSFSQQGLPPGLDAESIERHVLRLAQLTLNQGLRGLVCSPKELSSLRQLSSEAFLVTPGVRLPDDKPDDQRRTETPEAARAAGASAVVVGRPIYDAKDPRAAAERVLESLARGSALRERQGSKK